MLNATGPRTLRFLPPLVITEAEIDDALGRLRVAAGLSAPTRETSLTKLVVGETVRHARRHRHRGPRRRRGIAGPDPRRPARRAGRARVREHARGARRADPPEGELPPAGAGASRAGGARRGAPQGQLHRARAPGDRRLLRDLADRPLGGRAGSVARARPALRALAARGRGAPGPRGRRAHHRGERGRQAACDARDRQRGALRVRQGAGRVRRRAGRAPSTVSSPSTTTRPPPAVARTASSSRCTPPSRSTRSPSHEP